jgi:uncharacterized protein YbaP (TraB family)
MKRLFTMMLLLAFVVIGASAQLLYKISGKDLQKPSYIVGTYHLASATFADSIVGVKEAVNETEQMYGEVMMDELATAEGTTKYKDAMMLPDGKSLSSVLNAEQLKKLNSYLKESMGADLNNPMVAEQMGHMKPVTLTTQLTVLMYMQNNMNTFDPTNIIDLYFQKVAKKNNEFVGGLETLDYQINLLFNSTPMNRQVELLMCLIDHKDFYLKNVDDVIKAYYAQDLNGIKAAMDEKMNNSCDATPEENAQLIENRNADWLTKMPAIMTAKPTLFAVGAGHLPGDKGVLQLLRNAGYTVEAVK